MHNPNLNEDGEMVVHLTDGNTLRSGCLSGRYLSGEYVRLVDPDGNEILYWDNAEWETNPILVMGAIINAAAGLRVELTPDGALLPERWNPGSLGDDELNPDERKAVALIDGDERLAFFAAGCGSDDLEERLADEIERNDLDINVDGIDFVKVMNYFQNT